MVEVVTSVRWQAYEHAERERGADWYWILGMVVVSLAVVAILMGNLLFGGVVLVAGVVLGIAVTRPPRIVSYEVTTRGIRVDDIIYPYSSLTSYFIDEMSEENPRLLIRSEKLFMPLLTMPIPEEHVDDIEDILASRLPEEPLEEPWLAKALDFFGF